MKIQDALNNIKQFASNAAHRIGTAASAVGHGVAEFAKKVADFVKPHFESMKTFATTHKKEMTYTLGAFAAGAALYAIVSRLCAKKEEKNPIMSGFKA